MKKTDTLLLNDGCKDKLTAVMDGIIADAKISMRQNNFHPPLVFFLRDMPGGDGVLVKAEFIADKDVDINKIESRCETGEACVVIASVVNNLLYSKFYSAEDKANRYYMVGPDLKNDVEISRMDYEQILKAKAGKESLLN